MIPVPAGEVVAMSAVRTAAPAIIYHNSILHRTAMEYAQMYHYRVLLN